MPATRIYSEAWRDRIRPGIEASAAALVPLIIDKLRPRCVVDVGCGEGAWVREFEAAGIIARGVDGPWVEGVVHVNFDEPPYPRLGPYDMALCLEVAEHIDRTHADDLVAWLTSLADVVVFSAAIPGQGGTGHVNEQWPDYWAAKFEAHGFAGTGALRWEIWPDDRIEPWYRQNLLVFAADAETIAEANLHDDGCAAVVHPDIWSIYRK